MEDDSGDEASPQVARGGGGGGAVPGGGGGGDGGGAAVSGGSGGDGQQHTGDYRGWMLKSGPAGGDSDKTGVKRQLSVLSVSMRRAFFTMGDFKRRWCVRARAVDACCAAALFARAHARMLLGVVGPVRPLLLRHAGLDVFLSLSLPQAREHAVHAAHN